MKTPLERRGIGRSSVSAGGLSPSATSSRAPVVTVGATRETRAPWRAGLGEFGAAVMDAMSPVGRTDPRLLPFAASGLSQGVPSEGGFLVPPQFRSEVWDEMAADPVSLLPLCDQYPVEGESLTLNANGETSRATGSRYGGVRGYWIEEAEQLTASKAKVRQLKLEPHELAVLVPVTNKLLRHAPLAFGQYLRKAAAEEINFMIGDGIFKGSGAGKPLGFVTSPCAIEVAAEAGQAAGSVVRANISKMWARLHSRSKLRAVWLYNVDVEPNFDAFSTIVQNVAGTENVGGYADRVYDPEKNTLKGRPLIPCEFAATAGTSGDLVLVDLNAYALGLEIRGIEETVSMHVRYLSNESLFRWIFAVDGQPWLASPITPYQGSNTVSACVKLATRS